MIMSTVICNKGPSVAQSSLSNLMIHIPIRHLTFRYPLLL